MRCKEISQWTQLHGMATRSIDFFKDSGQDNTFYKKSTHRTSQNYLFGLIYSISVIKPSVFGLVIKWYVFFCIQFQGHVVTDRCPFPIGWLVRGLFTPLTTGK